ncbi:MAG: hypothetical protein HKN10_12470 [Myxococcales bacterium]|nr:hypothetical protein [Myxococcales bacterium]
MTQGQKGLCLVSYHPSQLDLSSGLTFDYVMALAGEGGLDEKLTAILPGLVDFEHRDGWPSPKMGQALLMRRGDPDAIAILTVGKRLIEHVRHWHKYASSHLPSAEVFRFRSFFGQTGAQADNLAAFRRELLLSDPRALHHHASHGEFSQWLQRSIRDETLARIARELEEQSVRDQGFERLRRELVEAIEDRYLT